MTRTAERASVCAVACWSLRSGEQGLQGYFAHKKQPPSLGPPQDPKYSPAVGSWEGGVSHGRGIPVGFGAPRSSHQPWLYPRSVEVGVWNFIRKDFQIKKSGTAVYYTA